MRSTETRRALAESVLNYIAEHPEKHDQSSFFSGDPNECGTTMCIAGTAAFLNAQATLNWASGNTEEKAQRLLGLNTAEKEALFFEMDNGIALTRLKKVAIGEEFSDDDFIRHQGTEHEYDLRKIWGEDYR